MTFKIDPMRAYPRIGVLLLVIFVVMQFTQPQRNVAKALSENDISKVYVIKGDLHQMLIEKCYDCHSNNTRYPWYFYVQPIGWWLAAHVHEGKEHLNFSEFKKYDANRAEHKLEELGEVVEDKSMPLNTYTMFHKNTALTPQDQQAIKAWISSIKATQPQ